MGFAAAQWPTKTGHSLHHDDGDDDDIDDYSEGYDGDGDYGESERTAKKLKPKKANPDGPTIRCQKFSFLILILLKLQCMDSLFRSFTRQFVRFTRGFRKLDLKKDDLSGGS